MTAFQLKLHIVAIATLFGLSVAFSIPLETEDSNINQLSLIGTIEGKTYFIEPNTTMTWLEGKAFCNASGMRLATVTSVAQKTLLLNAYNNVTFTDSHWVGGRDALKPSQFVWDMNDVTLNSTVLTPFTPEDGLQTCVVFRPYNKKFFGVLCTRQFKVLCELVHGKSNKV